MFQQRPPYAALVPQCCRSLCFPVDHVGRSLQFPLYEGPKIPSTNCRKPGYLTGVNSKFRARDNYIIKKRDKRIMCNIANRGSNGAFKEQRQLKIQRSTDRNLQRVS